MKPPDDSSLSARYLADTGSVRIADVCCGGHAPAGEEVSGADEVILVRRGVFVRRDRHGVTVADPAAVVFSTAGVPYRVSHPVAGGDRCTVLEFAEEIRREIFGPGDDARTARDVFPSPVSAASPKMQLMHRRLIALLCDAGSADPLEIDERAIALARETAPGPRAGVRPRSSRARSATLEAHRDLAARARTELSRDLDGRLTLAQLAGRVHSSPFHLCRVFHREVGMSIHRYRCRLRLLSSLERLLDRRRDLTDVALDAGFSSHSHFTTAFRREFGVPPSRALADPERV